MTVVVRTAMLCLIKTGYFIEYINKFYCYCVDEAKAASYKGREISEAKAARHNVGVLGNHRLQDGRKNFWMGLMVLIK